MSKLLEELTYFVYESESSFFDINKSEAQSFINDIENFEKKFVEYEDKVDKLEGVIKEAREYIEMQTPSDIGICGNSTKRYYTLGEDSVDHILEILNKVSK